MAERNSSTLALALVCLILRVWVSSPGRNTCVLEQDMIALPLRWDYKPKVPVLELAVNVKEPRTLIVEE